MTMNRDEAEQALEQIRQAQGRAGRAHSYADAAPFFILWGAIWLVANVVSGLAPALMGLVWLAGLAVGMAVTIWLSVAQARVRGERWRQAGKDPAAMGQRIGLTMGAIAAFLIALIFIIGPLDARQLNAAISLFWAFVYLSFGIWIGWRLALIGAITAGAVLFGYFALPEIQFVWMGLAAGGGLIAGGLWLRRV